ncbi:MAG: NusG domain II-containing protein [Neisseriaceae bacterium]|jgi:hypothetical protein|nr:MAG: NusG domain II-containing protein [Neisseriaceae bacterium]
MRPGDWLVAGAGVLALACLVPLQPQDKADSVVIRANGQVFRQLDLRYDQTVKVPGPLGDTVVQVADRRVRIERDPGPRQYCVRQSWLQQAGQAAVCLPNRTSIELKGQGGGIDTVSY